MKNYQCVLFDLDHTLWDYDANCREALIDLHNEYELGKRSDHTFEEFHQVFISINNELWDQYDRGLIHRDVIRNERFHRILQGVNIRDYNLSLELSQQYILQSPKKKNLIPNAIPMLDYLKGNYTLMIITNGFDEIQSTKLSSSGIGHYFKHVITSEKAGCKKPAREIFDYALTQEGFGPKEAIMIGDNLLTDIRGAKNAGVDEVFFNPNRMAHQEEILHEIADLAELKFLL